LFVPKLLSRSLIAVDVVAALVVGAVVTYAAVDASTPATPAEPRWVSVLFALLIAGPIAVRRFAPLPAFALCVVAEFVAVVSGVIPWVAMGAPVSAMAIVIYLVASATPRRRSVPALVAGVVTITAAAALSRVVHGEQEPWQDSAYGVAFGALLLGAGFTMGLTARVRREYTERTAAQLADRAVADERLRIARELHDIVAHSMSVIAVKAAIGNHVAEQRPDEARDALRVIEATSRGSLTEMRHLLGVLRSEVDSPALAPAPGPAGIPDLVASARSAGATVSAELDDASGLPEGIGLSVYRIVQESLTNVVRHAGPAACTVTVAVAEQTVRVEVTNDGRQAELRPGGHGLVGMRERVAVYGGTFEAGPREQGGWRVSAVLPVAPA
jgi:signal transduction histidine kinase